MKRCVQCGHVGLVEGHAEDTIRVGDRLFLAMLPAKLCPECDEAYFGAEQIALFEHQVAAELARAGQESAAVFAFMRKAIGQRSTELAQLLDVTPETVSRWEHGKVPIDRRAIALLGSLVLDAVNGSTATYDRLQALRERRELPSSVRLTVVPA